MSTSLEEPVKTHYLMDFSLYDGDINKQQRVGPKGYPAFRFVASSSIIDHQGDVVDQEALFKVMPIMRKQGGRIQGFHSNFPAGEFYDYGKCTLKNAEGKEYTATWVDVEFYDDYESQKQVIKDIQRSPEDPKKLDGLSLGGKELKTIKKCNVERCWNHIKELEGWEFSIVRKTANQLALQILDGDRLEGLNFPIVFQKGFLMDEQPRDTKGRFAKKEEDCETCPDNVAKGDTPPPSEEETTDTATKCKKCGGAIKDGKCTQCGAIEGNSEDEMSNEELGDEPAAEASNTSNDASNGAQTGYDEMDNQASTLESIQRDMQTLLSALNIGKENSIDKKVEALSTKVANLEKALPKPEPEKVIEKDGLKYRLVEEEETPEETTNGSQDGIIKALKEKVAELEKGQKQKIVDGGLPNDALDDEVEEYLMSAFGKSIPNRSVAPNNYLEGAIKKAVDSGVDDDSAEFLVRGAYLNKELTDGLDPDDYRVVT